MKCLLGLATSATLILNSTNALFGNDLMSGINPFLCSDASFVIIEDNNTWSIANSTADVSATENGWRIDNKDKSSVGYLRETGEGKWLLDWLTSDGHEQWDCIDLFSTTNKVVEIIKPKLGKNIELLQTELLLTKDKLSETQAELAAITTLRDKLKATFIENQEAEAKVVSLTEENDGLKTELKVSEGELKYLRPALKRERSELREATETIKTLKEELRVSQGKVKYYSNALEAERQSNKE